MTSRASALPEVDVAVEEETRTFWEALTRGELVIPWCLSCNDHVWPPKALCPVCCESTLEQRTFAGTGEIYSFTLVHRGEGAFAQQSPYVLAYVSVDGGPTMLANVIGANSALSIGDRVRLVREIGEVGHLGAVFELNE